MCYLLKIAMVMKGNRQCIPVLQFTRPKLWNSLPRVKNCWAGGLKLGYFLFVCLRQLFFLQIYHFPFNSESFWAFSNVQQHSCHQTHFNSDHWAYDYLIKIWLLRSTCHWQKWQFAMVWYSEILATLGMGKILNYVNRANLTGFIIVNVERKAF